MPRESSAIAGLDVKSAVIRTRPTPSRRAGEPCADHRFRSCGARRMPGDRSEEVLAVEGIENDRPSAR